MLRLGRGRSLIGAGRIATMSWRRDHSGATRSTRNHERAMEFTIVFSPDARDHLRSLKRRDQQIVIDAIAAQFTHQADQPTSNRKLLRDNRLAPWELRIGDHRVFYDIKHDNKLVVIVAVGKKFHNRLLIGGEEIEL